MADATKLLDTVSDHQTALQLFAQCTLNKLPHLLGSEVLYCHTQTGDEWTGSLTPWLAPSSPSSPIANPLIMTPSSTHMSPSPKGV